MNNDYFVSELSKIRPSSTFLALNEYKNSHGEVADYGIVFHVSYQSILERSVVELGAYIPENEIESQAKDELIKSYESSLERLKSKPQEELEDAYTHFKDDSGNYVKGIKLHKESNTLHIYGVVNTKKIIVPGTYKEVKSKEITVAKNKLTKNLPISKWRQFKITPDQVKSIKVEKLELTTEK